MTHHTRNHRARVRANTRTIKAAPPCHRNASARLALCLCVSVCVCVRVLSYRQGLKGAAKRWEDDLNDFVKDEETEATQSNDLKPITHGLLLRKKVYEWEKKERQSAKHVNDD